MSVPHHIAPKLKVIEVIEEIERTASGKVRRLIWPGNGAVLTEHHLDGLQIDHYDKPKRKDALQWVHQWGCWHWRM